MSQANKLLQERKELLSGNRVLQSTFSSPVVLYNKTNGKFIRKRKDNSATESYRNLTSRELRELKEHHIKTHKSVGQLLLFAGAIALTIKGISSLVNKLKEHDIKIPLMTVKTSESIEGYEAPQTSATSESTGKTSEQGIKDILNYEGFIPVAKDIEGKGILTIGYGHRGKDVKPGQTITREQAFNLFKSDLKSREDTVNRMVKVPITQSMFDALVSFVYNAGSGNFAKSDTLKLLNQGKYKEAAERMKTEYINKGTKHEEGLRNRRAKESAKILNDLTNVGTLKEPQKAIQKVEPTESGSTKKYAKDSNIGGYITPWTVTLSDRAERYLRETGGKGIVTSGSDGKSHTKSGVITHGSGNKVDIQGRKGKHTTNAEYAELCIKFLKNPNTAYINLESFSKKDVAEVLEYIKTHDSTAYELAFKSTPYTPSKNYTWFNNYKLLCSVDTSHPKHLDIGILPNAYSVKQKDNYNLTNNNTEQAKTNVQQTKPVEKSKETKTKKVAFLPKQENLFIKQSNNILANANNNDTFKNTLLQTMEDEEKDRIGSIV